jgi:hypothetical protein
MTPRTNPVKFILTWTAPPLQPDWPLEYSPLAPRDAGTRIRRISK